MRGAKTTVRRRGVPAPRAGGRSSGKGICRSQRGGALTRLPPWRGSPKGNVWRLHDLAGSRAPARCRSKSRRLIRPERRFVRLRAGPFRVPARAGNREPVQSPPPDFRDMPPGSFPGRWLPALRAERNEPLGVPLNHRGIAISHAANLPACQPPGKRVRGSFSPCPPITDHQPLPAFPPSLSF